LDFSEKSYTMVRLKSNSKNSSEGPKFISEKGTAETGDALEMELRSFIEAVKTRCTPAVCGEDGKKALAMALWINQEIEKNIKSANPFPGAAEFFKTLGS
jgi:hypothetical protein